MKERSPRRIAADEQIRKEANSALVHALPPFFLYKTVGMVNRSLATKLYNGLLESHKTRYHQANETVRQIEEEEGFPNVRRYIEFSTNLCNRIPDQARQTAFYPFAGIDVFWAAPFDNLILEDKNYDAVQDDPTLWWSVNDYKTERLEHFVSTLKMNGLIPQDHKVTFKKSNSDTGEMIDHFNHASATLIYKAGATFHDFIKKIFKNRRVEFGAIIVSNDNSPADSLQHLLSYHNYQKAHELNPPHIVIPWTLPLHQPKVYLKV